MKILIIEDEPSLRELMCRELTKEQYVVASAATFAEAYGFMLEYHYIAGRHHFRVGWPK